ncbi:hypothetical protein SAMN04487869_1122 [Marinobacter sp. DSM 26671]|uniref:hypothetical protein n=1 Tax=Marinobacter sp. DSM 26671 TaxID=1761793 RepID=UPI0008E104AF|nr:hypothetical protein [Marinobacter sp. DSM 26671]SFE63184.1 hypothetical protein SAMN04487869_1122 [Marinobacter sp. DSM 26671]
MGATTLTEEEFQRKKAEILSPGNSQDTASGPQSIEIWNPTAAANWSLLFSPIFGAFLQAKNWKSLGEQNKSKSSMLWVYLGCLIIFLVLIVPGLAKYGSGIGIIWLLFWYFTASKSQTKYVKEKYNDEYEKKGWFKPIIIAIGLIFSLIIVTAVFESTNKSGFNLSSDDPSVAMVKDGSLYTCKSHTVEELVNSFMGNPSWASGVSDSGVEFVNIEGDIMYANKEVRATLQLKINESEQSFEFQAIEMNGVPQNKMIANALLNKMCDSASQ